MESGISSDYDVPVYYDPLLAKLITWGTDRDEAIARMLRALDEYKIKGVKTTIPFHRKILVNSDFTDGNYDTGIVSRIKHHKTSEFLEISAIAATIVAMDNEKVDFVSDVKQDDRWKLSGRMYGGIRSMR